MKLKRMKQRVGIIINIINVCYQCRLERLNLLYFRARQKTKKLIIGKTNHSIIVLPPKIWFKFRSVEKLSLVVIYFKFSHKDKEGLKIPIKT